MKKRSLSDHIKGFFSGMGMGIRIPYNMIKGRSFKECMIKEFNEDYTTLLINYKQEKLNNETRR